VQSSAEFSGKTNSARPFLPRAFLLLGALAALCLFIPRLSAADNSVQQETAQRFAERIAAIAGLHGPLRLEWHPDAQWPEGESNLWQQAIRAELEKRSLNLTEDAVAPPLAIYAQETPTQVVLTGKTHVGEREEVRIVEVARALLPPSELPVAPVRLDRQMIYESPDRILDASSLWNGAEGGLVILLYKNFEVVAERLDAKNTLQQSVSLNAASLKPTRDPRAELTPQAGRVSVQLWSKACDFFWDAPGDVKCHMDKSATTTIASATAAKSPWRGPTLLTSPCDGSGWKLLNSAMDPTVRDVLQVIPDGASRESSSGVLSEFPGPILSTNGGQNPASALIVARNLRTGNYEVYKITLACGD
jgi:hypothetical protein